MHFCHEELFALIALITGSPVLLLKLRTWWHSWRKTKKCECGSHEHGPVQSSTETNHL